MHILHHNLLTVQILNVKICSKFEQYYGPQDHFDILRKIKKKSNPSQRELAKELGFSLANLIIAFLRKKGLVKNQEF